MLCSALEILGLIVPWSFATPTLVQPTPAVPSADNQPQPSSCAQKPLSAPAPSREVFDGTLTCHTETIPRSDPLFYMTKEEASNAINTFCGRIHEGVAFNTNGGVLVQSAQDDGPFGYPMRLSAFWTPGDRTDCPTLDFSNSSSYAVCRQSLKRNIIDECERRTTQDLATVLS